MGRGLILVRRGRIDDIHWVVVLFSTVMVLRCKRVMSVGRGGIGGQGSSIGGYREDWCWCVR